MKNAFVPRKHKKKIDGGSLAFRIVMFAILASYSAIMIFLFVWALFSSLRNHSDFLRDPMNIFQGLSIKNYADIFEYFYITVEGYGKVYVENMFLNSMLYALGGALFQAFCTAIVAYCTARYPCKLSTIIHYVVIVTMILPVVGNTASMLTVTNFLHTKLMIPELLIVYLMKFGFNNVYYLVFYAAFKRISWDYAEAAFVDGAGHFKVFFTIMFPLVLPLFLTVTLLNFIVYWNDFETPYLYMKTTPTLAVYLYGIINQGGVSETIVNSTPLTLGCAILVFLPVLILFIIFKNKLMGNLTEGGVKG